MANPSGCRKRAGQLLAASARGATRGDTLTDGWRWRRAVHMPVKGSELGTSGFWGLQT